MQAPARLGWWGLLQFILCRGMGVHSGVQPPPKLHCIWLPKCIAFGLQAASCVFPGAATAFRWRSSGRHRTVPGETVYDPGWREADQAPRRYSGEAVSPQYWQVAGRLQARHTSTGRPTLDPGLCTPSTMLCRCSSEGLSVTTTCKVQML